jgi:uncharacterized protein
MESQITRRHFLAGAAAIALTGHIGRGSSPSSAEQLAEFDYSSVQLTGGPLKQQYDGIRAAYLALDNDRLLKVYRERAGLPAPGKPMGGWYGRDGFVPGHALGQYVSGLARIGKTTGDDAFALKVHELVDEFAATLGPKDRCFAGPNAENVWPCYVLDKHLAGLIDAYNLSGVNKARELLSRVFRGALPLIPERGHDRVGKRDPPYDETYVLPESLFTAYELTGERAFYDRAVAYLLDDDFFDPLAAGHDVLPGRHAYSHVIALSSAGKARLIRGDEKYLGAMGHAWNLLKAGQQYATGGWGPNETFVEPHQGRLFESLRTTADHFETPCGSYAAIKLARYLLRATGEARYGDGLERVLLNGVLAVKQPDGEGGYPYYSTYGVQARKILYPAKWPCCSGTLIESVADYVKNIYFRANDGVAVILYAPSQLVWEERDAQVTLSQQTEFPLGETVAFRVHASTPVDFALRLRIPEWAAATPTITIDGKRARFDIDRGFAVIRRRWNSGNTLALQLPQTFRAEPIDELHPNTVALMRGPLVYAELNPADSALPHAKLDALRAGTQAGVFTAETGPRARTYLPFYSIRDESYTMYNQRGEKISA